jgi:hypothetical protein
LVFTRPKTPPDRPEKGEWIVDSRDRDEVRSFLTDAARVVKAMREAPNRPGKWLHAIEELGRRLYFLKPTWCGLVDTRLMAIHVERPDCAGPDATIETFATFLDAPACFPEAAGPLHKVATLYFDLYHVLSRLRSNAPRAGDDADAIEWYCDKIREALGLPTDAGPPCDVGGEKPLACPAGGGESAGPALTENQSRVLRTMARFDASQLLSSKKIAEEMDAMVRLSEETVRQCVGKLIGKL